MNIFFIDRESYQHFIDNYKPSISYFSFKFLDYHKREKWHHIGIKENNKVIGVIPGYIENNEFISLKGSSFGGILIKADIKRKIKAINEVESFLREKKIVSMKVTLPPFLSIYRDTTLDYILWNNGFTISNKELGMGIDLQKFTISSHHKKNIKKSGNFVIRNGSVKEAYPLILETWSKFNKSPTHTLEELEYLENNFENFIDTYIALDGNNITGAVLLFNINENISLLFYPVQNEEGKNKRVMFKLMDFVIKDLKSREIKYLDLGTVSSKGKINYDLIRFKKGWGAGFYTRDTYIKKL